MSAVWILFIFGVVMILPILAPAIWYAKKKQKLISDFKTNISNRIFTKRIVVFDYFSNSTKNIVIENCWMVGIWLDYPKRLMAIRPDKDAIDVIDIPFDKIQNVEVIEDGYTITTGGGLGLG